VAQEVCTLSRLEKLKLLTQEATTLSLALELAAQEGSTPLRLEELKLVTQEATTLLRLEELEIQLLKVVLPHSATLRRLYRQSVFVDHFGLVDRRRWDKEVLRFVVGIVEPHFDFPRTRAARSVLIGFIDEIAASADDEAEMDEPIVNYSEDMSPTEYESYCAEELRVVGWHAETTKATGDQGADVIASRDGVRLVVQCKKYTNAVGNDAVQQVIAAKMFHDGHIAAVISSAPFTVSAKLLAAKADVVLLHHSGIKTFNKLPQQ
jgi:restriction system protein